jgi:hypothetical protein
MGIQWMLCWWMLVHHGPKNAKDQLVLLPAMDGHTQKVSKDMFGACKYLLAYNHHAHNIGSLQVELKNKADCPFFSLNEHFSFVVCVLRMNMGRNLHMIWCICIASHMRQIFFSLPVVCGKAIHNYQVEDSVSLFLFPPSNRQLHGCM